MHDNYQSELAPFFFLLEEAEVIAEASEDWEPWGPFLSYSQLVLAWEKLQHMSLIDRLDGLGFFVLWNSVKRVLPALCSQRFVEFPPVEEHIPGAILFTLLDSDGFESFNESLVEYLSGLDDELEELVSSSEEQLLKWWEKSRIEVLNNIWKHSDSLRNSLVDPVY